MLRKRLTSLSVLTLFMVSSALIMFTPKTSAITGSDFKPGRIIDDSKFFTGTSPMSISDIQVFLNAKVPVCDTNGTQLRSPGVTRAQYSASNGVSPPFTCLKDARDTINAKSAEAGLCNSIPQGSGTAAEIIYWVGTSCGVNVQVLIILIQKEQSLITDDWPWPIQYRSATGYGCPDTAPCDTEYYGFFNQVYNAARQFKRYARDSSSFNFRAGLNANIQYNPNAGCGSSSVYIENQATAGLYNYTPYQPNASALANLYGTGDSCGAYGNRNFWRLFNDWFGSTYGPPDYSCKNGVAIPGAPSGAKVVHSRVSGNIDNLSLVFPNNGLSGCIETHTWTINEQGWISNIATNHPSVNPTDASVITADVDGDGRDEFYLVKYRNTVSGRIEIHRWDSTNQHWYSNIATNHPAVDPGDNEVIAADVDGIGKEKLVLVKYRNTTSGKIEVHTWADANFQTWYSNIATNHPAVDPGDARVIAANTITDVGRKDKLILVKYRNTTSGKIEVHTWGLNEQLWYSNIATNHPAVDPADASIIASAPPGDGKDKLILVKYRNTTSGKIEVHTWGLNEQLWYSNIATNHPAI